MRQAAGPIFWAVSLGFMVSCARTPVKKESPAPLGRVAPAIPAPVEPLPLPDPPTSDADAVDAVSVFFDFDSYVLKPESGPLLQSIAATAKGGHRSLRIEGHCDERGTPEYNLALGEGRARSVQKYLERLGIPTKKMSVISFGSQRPRVQGKDEAAWSQNRRGDVKLE
jgi:peptidoglycan-associated lipoprotein